MSDVIDANAAEDFAAEDQATDQLDAEPEPEPEPTRPKPKAKGRHKGAKNKPRIIEQRAEPIEPADAEQAFEQPTRPRARGVPNVPRVPHAQTR